jgi:Cu(I)/Ag(I) efflux system membrane protein CusA/SilA
LVIDFLIAFSVRNRALVLGAFAIVAALGARALLETPVDALPDLSENQVIVFADWMGRSPREVEDQVTHPLTVTLEGLRGVKTVRSSSEFNFAMIDVIFEENVGLQAARATILERLASSAAALPPGVVPYLAPDASAVGQIFWYTLEGDGYDLAQLRSTQDWYVRYQLTAVPGVAQVASVGGHLRELQVDVDPGRLAALGVTLGQVVDAVSKANASAGGQVLHENGAEYLIRVVGWAKNLEDVGAAVVAMREGVPILVKEAATLQFGPAPRRSVLERDGRETVGGVVLMRQGENPLEVTRRVKARIADLSPGLPPGVRIVPFYDRTRLIEGALGTLVRTLLEEIAIASIVVILILGHARSALVVCLALPAAVLVSFLFMGLLGVPSNIMSLSGIAISIGVLVDAAIVMVENATTTLRARHGPVNVGGDTSEDVIAACRTVGRPLFFAVAIIIVSFLPVFALGGTEGKLFRPLAFTKTFALAGVLVFTATVVPALLPSLLRGRLRADDESWLVRSVKDVYRPVLTWLLPRPRLCLWLLFVLVLVGVELAPRLGREFMPPLDEGTILEMPTSIARTSIEQAGEDLRFRDSVLRTFPEVASVVGKAGRADTPTDPAPPEMIETMINLLPHELWPRRGADPALVERVAGWAEARLAEIGVVAGGKGLAHDAAVAAINSFDASCRDLLNARRREDRPLFEAQLVAGVVQDMAHVIAARGRLQRALTTDDLNALVAELGPRHGRWLAETTSVEEVSSIAREAVPFLVVHGLVERDTPDLLGLPGGSLLESWEELRETLGFSPDTFERRLVVATDARRERLHDAARRRAEPELAERASGRLARALVEGTCDAARAAHALLREPSEGERVVVAQELEKDALGSLVLHRKQKDELVREMDATLAVPGWGNIWTQPIVNRVDMLATGVRSTVGVKVSGGDLETVQEVSRRVAEVLKKVPGAVDVFPDQVTGKSYIEIVPDRVRAARLGVNVADVNEAIEVALGGRPLSLVVDGPARFPVRVRYTRDARQSIEAVRKVLVMGSVEGARAQVPLAEIARVEVVEGPSVIRTENGLLRSYVQLNVHGRDTVGFVEEARRSVLAAVQLPKGVFLEWSGEFEAQLRARRTLKIVLPLVLAIILVVLQLTFRDRVDTLLTSLAVPGAMAGGVIFQALWGIPFSVAVWIGYIACFGLATETGIIMLIYLREALARRGGVAALASEAEVDDAVLEGAVQRLRPKLLTEAVIVLGLVPMLWAHGTGSEILRPMAVPVLGGILFADEVIDLFLPVFFAWFQKRRWRRAKGVQS